MNKVRTKGTKFGQCNICNNYCKLTDDHIPPKGSVNIQKVGIRSITQIIDTVNPGICRVSQNGVKFRSLCEKCNNLRLGKQFDPSLNDFSRKVARIIRLRSRYIFPQNIDVEIRPQRVARSIIGHLLAAEIRDDMADSPRKAPMVDAMRQYFLDEMLDLPNDLRLYFWPYPANRQVILRGIGLVSGKHIVIGDFLKYFPFAFWLAYQPPKNIVDVMKDREILIRGYSIDMESTVSIATCKQDTFRVNWPETPDDTEIILLNDGMCFIAEPI